MMNKIDRSELLRRLHRTKVPLLISTFALLLLLSTGKGGSKNETAHQTVYEVIPMTLSEEETRLAETLMTISGVGKTQVLLSVRVSAQTDYLSDENKTVILSAGSGKQEAVAIRSRSAEYLGAVIACEGGDNPNTQWDVTEAVSRFTGLRADQITVLKLQE